MHSIQHLSTDPAEQDRRETKIFDACRANPNREPRGRVTFRPTIDGHEATLRNAEGIVVTIATVDEFDV